MHAYLAQLGLSGADSEDHQKFLDRREYLQSIKDLFPNEDDDFYEVVMYAGCVDCETFISLSRNEQTYIIDLLNDYLYL